jgi:hypothetical protein
VDGGGPQGFNCGLESGCTLDIETCPAERHAEEVKDPRIIVKNQDASPGVFAMAALQGGC